LQGFDASADILSGLGGLTGQGLDLSGDHRKTLAGFTGARRLDGGVERQQVGLVGDLGNRINDLRDLTRRVLQPFDARIDGFKSGPDPSDFIAGLDGGLTRGGRFARRTQSIRTTIAKRAG
jgi:hypothetical protein